MDKIYIFGHKNPDTDTVTSAISLEYLKKQLGIKCEAKVLGQINKETEYVLNYFNIKTPKYLNDVKLQIKDVEYHKDYYINEGTSLEQTYNYMNENNITGIPIVDGDNKFMGIITAKTLLKEIFNASMNYLYTSYDNIIHTLNGEEILRFDDELIGNIMAASYKSTTFIESVPLTCKDILIVGDRHSIIETAVKNSVKLIIITGNSDIKEEHIKIAKENNVNIIRTNYDTFVTVKKIGLSNYIRNLISSDRPYTVLENEYYDDFINKTRKLKFNNYPVINKDNVCKGLLRITEINKKNKKRVILVDHNEFEQSVIGLDEAEILEVIDHHKIGNISTNNPINFRNMNVGSTNTIVYHLYKENMIDIPEDIAGIMMAGILSDTLSLTSPTTTDIDREVIKDLEKICKVNHKEFAMNMFKAGSSLEGKTEDEIIKIDMKSFQANSNKFSISQVLTLNYEQILDDKQKYIEAIEKYAKEKQDDFVLLTITDVINQGSYILYTEKIKDMLEEALGINNIYQGYYLQGVVSRKKQLVPLIMEYLN